MKRERLRNNITSLSEFASHRDNDTESTPSFSDIQKIWPVIRASLKRRQPLLKSSTLHEPVFKDRFFYLDRVARYQRLSPEKKSKLVESCSQRYIEQLVRAKYLSHQFTLRMNELCGHSEVHAPEKILYGILESDESIHIASLNSFLTDPLEFDPVLKETVYTPFEEVLKTESKQLLVFVFQVILKGWLITHYHEAIKNSCEPSFQRAMDDILQDEARHHSLGLSAIGKLSPNSLESAHTAHVVNSVIRSLRKLFSTPQDWVLNELCPSADPECRSEVLAELGLEARSRRKLELLKAILQQADRFGVLQATEALGAFQN